MDATPFRILSQRVGLPREPGTPGATSPLEKAGLAYAASHDTSWRQRLAREDVGPGAA